MEGEGFIRVDVLIELLKELKSDNVVFHVRFVSQLIPHLPIVDQAYFYQLGTVYVKLYRLRLTLILTSNKEQLPNFSQNDIKSPYSHIMVKEYFTNEQLFSNCLFSFHTEKGELPLPISTNVTIRVSKHWKAVSLTKESIR